MAWVAVATVVVGGANIYSANKASRDADELANKQQEANTAQLDFQKQQYDDWQSVYGPIQERLSSFYEGLDAETFAASGLQAYEKEFRTSQKDIQRSFAQRGIDTDVQDFMSQNASLRAAEAKAGIRADASLKVASAQQDFVAGGRSNPNAPGIARTMGQQADRYGDQANQYATQAQQGYDAVGNLIIGGATEYARQQTVQNQTTPQTAHQAQVDLINQGG